MNDWIPAVKTVTEQLTLYHPWVPLYSRGAMHILLCITLRVSRHWNAKHQSDSQCPRIWKFRYFCCYIWWRILLCSQPWPQTYYAVQSGLKSQTHNPPASAPLVLWNHCQCNHISLAQITLSEGTECRTVEQLHSNSCQLSLSIENCKQYRPNRGNICHPFSCGRPHCALFPVQGQCLWSNLP